MLFWPLVIAAQDNVAISPLKPPIQFSADEKAWLESHPIVRMGYDPYFPPLEFSDESGTYVGMAAEYISILNERLGLNIIPAPNIKNWPIANEMGKNKELDIFPVITPSPERKEYWIFSDVYLEYSNVIFTRDDYPAVTGLESLSGKSVSAPIGYVSFELIKNNYPEIKLVGSDSILDGLKKVSSGQVDAFVGDIPTTVYYMRKNNMINLKVASPTTLKVKGFAMAIRDDWPELVSILNKGLSSITDEERQKISDKWIKLKYDPIINYSFVWKLISIFLIILVLISIWIRLLQNQRRTITSAKLKVDKARDELEIRVKERTAELLEINEKLESEIDDRVLSENKLRASEARYKQLFANSEISIWNEDFSEVLSALEQLRMEGVEDLREYLVEDEQVAWDMAGKVRVVGINQATLTLFGAKSEKDFFFQIDKTFGLNAIDIFREQLHAIWDKQPIFRSEARYKTLDGKDITCIISLPVPQSKENSRNVPVSIIDITERKKIEEELLTQSQIITNMEEGAYLIRVSDATIVYTNAALDTMFGYESGEMLGQHVSIVNAPTDNSPKETADIIINALSNSGVWRGEVRNIKKDGTPFWCSATVSTFDHPIYGTVWASVHADISERKAIDEKLSYQASHDALTGLPNRAEFEHRATRLISTLSTEDLEHAMCFLDLDQFKVINDSCGHPAGDELLRQLGRLLQKVIRKRDTFARLGGDEFGVLMEHCSLEQANRVAENILKAIADYQFAWDSKVFRIGVSIGLVAVTKTTGDFTNLFKQADAACYLAKDLGRNRIYIYHPDDAELAVRHGEMQWVERINNALDNNQFCLHAQPILSLESNSRRHFEILIRMLEGEGEIVPPGAFLPAAERYNLIGKIDAWVLNNVCSMFGEHLDFFNKMDFVSINLSGPSLTDHKFLETILRTFRNSKIPPNKICFEVTETVAVSNMDSAREFIQTLKKEGFRFALDDFGSGISSFGYLKNLPVDYLKIDGVFVKDIVEDPIDYAMVKSINEVGHLMGMKTIAEFVENDEVKGMLKAIGVDYGQGYGLGKPESILDLIVESENINVPK